MADSSDLPPSPGESIVHARARGRLSTRRSVLLLRLPKSARRDAPHPKPAFDASSAFSPRSDRPELFLRAQFPRRGCRACSLRVSPERCSTAVAATASDEFLIMRVLHIQRVKAIGGSERHLLALLPGLAARGVDVRICVLQTGERRPRRRGPARRGRRRGGAHRRPGPRPSLRARSSERDRTLPARHRAHAPRSCRPLRAHRRACASRAGSVVRARNARVLRHGAVPQRRPRLGTARGASHRDLGACREVPPRQPARRHPTVCESCTTASTPASRRRTTPREPRASDMRLDDHDVGVRDRGTPHRREGT